MIMTKEISINVGSESRIKSQEPGARKIADEETIGF